MAREINLVNCVHVISEPGDATRYEFIAYRFGDEISIMPVNSSFKYPQRINIWAAKSVIEDISSDIITDINGDIITDISEIFSCNPHTVLEVCKSIVAIWGDDVST